MTLTAPLPLKVVVEFQEVIVILSERYLFRTKFCLPPLSFNQVDVDVFAFAGKRAFIAGVADDQGFGWAITKALAEAGAEILLGTWVPVSHPTRFSARRQRSIISISCEQVFYNDSHAVTNTFVHLLLHRL